MSNSIRMEKWHPRPITGNCDAQQSANRLNTIKSTSFTYTERWWSQAWQKEGSEFWNQCDIWNLNKVKHMVKIKMYPCFNITYTLIFQWVFLTHSGVVRNRRCQNNVLRCFIAYNNMNMLEWDPAISLSWKKYWSCLKNLSPNLG